MKPNLFIVGAPKCGTTAWVEYLGSHPDIFFSRIKEPHHFATDRDPELRIADRDAYLRLFARTGGAKVVGEASVTYLLSPVAAKNIHAFNPAAKILIFVRNQEDYLPSRHNQLVFNGDESIADFEQAWRLSGRRDGSNVPASNKHPELLDYRAAGAFSPQVERYYALFPEQQIRVFHFDSWIEDPRRTYLEILRFLGLPDDGRTHFPAVHQARHHASKLIVKLVRNPPRIVRSLVTMLRKLTGRSGLGVANRLLELDSRPGTLSQVSDALRHEIRDYYKKDNDELQRRIWPPERARAADRSSGEEASMGKNVRDTDDELIDRAEELPTPAQAGAEGGNLARDIGAEDEEERFVEGKTGVTRVRKSDEDDSAMRSRDRDKP